jgi:hypothetical protein
MGDSARFHDGKRSRKPARMKEITPSGTTCQDDGWRPAIEWLGQPAEGRDLEEGHDEVQYGPLPDAIVDEIARITGIRASVPKPRGLYPEHR